MTAVKKVELVIRFVRDVGHLNEAPQTSLFSKSYFPNDILQIRFPKSDSLLIQFESVILAFRSLALAILNAY